MGTGGLRELAFIGGAMGLVDPSMRWQNPTPDFWVPDRRGSRKE